MSGVVDDDEEGEEKWNRGSISHSGKQVKFIHFRKHNDRDMREELLQFA